MHNHEPKNYLCPFCLVSAGKETERLYTKQADMVYKDAHVMAFIASHGWPNNHGHVIVSIRKHYENIYDIPERLLARVAALEKKIALAVKRAYKCAGITLRQNNEPVGGQDLWHYHSHVFPRYPNDMLNELTNTKRELSSPLERKKHAIRLRRYVK